MSTYEAYHPIAPLSFITIKATYSRVAYDISTVNCKSAAKSPIVTDGLFVWLGITGVKKQLILLHNDVTWVACKFSLRYELGMRSNICMIFEVSVARKIEVQFDPSGVNHLA